MERDPAPHDPELLADLFRFAKFFFREDRRSQEVVEKALRSLQGKPEAREERRAVLSLFARIARLAPSRIASPTAEIPTGSAALEALRLLPSCARLAIALKLCSPLGEEEAARVAGCKPAEWRKVCASLPEIEREALREELQPGEVAQRHLAAWENPQRLLRSERRGWLDPMALALGFAFLLLLGWGIWGLLARAGSFPGEDEARKLLELGSAAGAEDYEPVDLPLGALGDWLALKGVEGFWVPPELATQQTVAARVFTHQNVRVAAVALPEKQMLVYIFDGVPLGIEVRPPGNWRLFPQGQNAGAIAQRGRICVLAAVRGTPKDLRHLLQTGKRS